MALFHGAIGPMRDQPDQYFRTNTKLQVSTHDSPGEKFLVDPRLRRLFRYHFGGDGWVVIPKGRIVAPATNGGPNDDGRFKDFDLDKFYPALTLANGGVDVEEIGRDGQKYIRKANRPIGVASQNIYEEIPDGFNGMQPTIENEIYIEVPYIVDREHAEMMEWGCYYDQDPNRPVKPGDYVMSDENGRFIKADFDKVREDIEAAKAEIENASDLNELKAAMKKLADAEKEYTRLCEQVVGQVWAVDTNLPPHGWLQWVTWSEDEFRSLDDYYKTGFRPEDIGSTDHPGYPYEKTYRNTDFKSGKYFPKGIPGLTDGSNIEVPFEDVVIGQVMPGQKGRHDFRIIHTPLVEGSVVVKANGTPITPDYINYQTGLVVISSVDNTQGTEPIVITASYKATGQIPGVPTNWDFKGSKGAVRILLQK